MGHLEHINNKNTMSRTSAQASHSVTWDQGGWSGLPSGFAYLLEDNGLSVELVCGVGGLLDLGGDGEAQSRQLPDLPQQRHQAVRVLDLQPAVQVVQVHHPVTGLQTEEGGELGEGRQEIRCGSITFFTLAAKVPWSQVTLLKQRQGEKKKNTIININEKNNNEYAPPDTGLRVGQSGQYFSGPIVKLLLLVGPENFQEVITETQERAKG